MKQIQFMSTLRMVVIFSQFTNYFKGSNFFKIWSCILARKLLSKQS